MPEFHYFEGSQRVQREAVIEVLQSIYRKSSHRLGLFRSPEAHLLWCEARAVGKFKKPVVILARKNEQFNMTVRLA